MAATYIYPGSFCPPTYGHAAILSKAAATLPFVTVVCSRNPKKNGYWFSEKECLEMWQGYDLPRNCEVITLSELMSRNLDPEDLVMVRGVRTEKDLVDEKDVMAYNFEHFGIDKYLYVLSDEDTREVSSGLARESAEKVDLTTLAKCVCPEVVTALLEKALGFKNLVMVVGPPGSGKSTVLETLCEVDPNSVVIKTDEFNHALRGLLKEAFGEENLFEVALEREDELQRVISKPWLELLSSALKNVTRGANVFVEVAYGMRPNMQIFRYLGAKVLYLGASKEVLNARCAARSNPKLAVFIEHIPDLDESCRIAYENKLRLEWNLTDQDFDLETLGFFCQMLQIKMESDNLWPLPSWH